LKVFPIQLPPLHQRRDDLPLLVGHFIRKFNAKTAKQILGVSQAAMRLLMDYSWPGNVRELENAIEHAFVVCNREQIEPYDLPIDLRQVAHPTLDRQEAQKRDAGPYQRVKVGKAELLAVLNDTDWNKAEAARRIGVSRTAVWKYMKKYEIPLKEPD
jgi:DNA-binding NtrC family response regulator